MSSTQNAALNRDDSLPQHRVFRSRIPQPQFAPPMEAGALPGSLPIYIAKGKFESGLEVATRPGGTFSPWGTDKDGGPVYPTLRWTTIQRLFEEDEPADGHLVAYVVVRNGRPLIRQPRLNKSCLDGLRARGYDVIAYTLWVDLDLRDLLKASGKINWSDLDEEQSSSIVSRISGTKEALGWAACFTTRGGFRFVHALAQPVPIGPRYESLLLRLHDRYRAAGLPIDESCKDWTRLYRCPRAVRDGVQQSTELWFLHDTERLDDPTASYQPSSEDLTPPPVSTTAAVALVRTERERPEPEAAKALVEVLVERDGKTAWRPTEAAKKAKHELQDAAVYGWVFDRLPLAFPGQRHDMLTRAVGEVVAHLHGHKWASPEFTYGLLHDPVAGLGDDEDWLGKLWEMTTSFWAKETTKKLQKAAPSPRSASDELEEVLVEPAGQNAAEWLDYLNRKHAVIGDLGGKCMVVSFAKENGRHVLRHQAFADITKRYGNRIVQVAADESKQETKGRVVGRWWLDHPKRRQFEQIVYEPGKPQEFNGNLNLWQGFGVEPAPGDWSLMRRHVLEVLASGNVDHADYILKWAAWAVQNPEKPAEVALVFRGGQATGKGTFARALKDIFGQHGVHISRAQELTGRFNAHLRDCSLLFSDEAFAADDKEAVGQLKALVTEPTIRIESKGLDGVEARNCLKIVMASNERWVVAADADDRRFVVFDVPPSHREDGDWFGPLYQQMEDGGLAAMLHDLLAMDLRGWHPRQNRPRTAAHAEQKAESLRGVDRHWFECLAAGELPAGIARILDGGWVEVSTSGLLDWMREQGARDQSLTLNRLSALLKGPQGGSGGPAGMGFEGFRQHNVRMLRIPPLDEARRCWDEVRYAHPWEAAEGWTVARG